MIDIQQCNGESRNDFLRRRKSEIEGEIKEIDGYILELCKSGIISSDIDTFIAVVKPLAAKKHELEGYIKELNLAFEVDKWTNSEKGNL